MDIKPVKDTLKINNIHIVFNSIFMPHPGAPTPFQPSVEKKDFLYPVEYKLTQELYESLRKATKLIGDDVFYLSIIEPPVNGSETTNWIISLKNDDYFKIHLENHISENAIFSPQGKWGFLFYDFGLVFWGGTTEFFKVFIENIPSHNGLDVFLQEYKHNASNFGDPDYSFLSTWLSHMYGKEKAEFLMNKYSFNK